jgi:hypothetical protein
MISVPLLPANSSNPVRLFSFGGGVQSTAVLVLQAQGKLWRPYDWFVFADVGHDSENPDTITYVETIAKSYAAKYGIKFVEVQKTTYGEPETLWGYIHRVEKSVPIPARMSNGAPGNRSCTNDFKIKVVDKWIKSHGYTHATVGLGLSVDEFGRVRNERWHDSVGKKRIGFCKKREHPLIDLRMSRQDCHNIIRDAGLPMPPKSACFFCPFKRRNEWIEFKKAEPLLFEKCVQLEKRINEKRNAMGRDFVYLHSSCKPLAQAVGNQPMLPMFGIEEDVCESGYCFT